MKWNMKSIALVLAGIAVSSLLLGGLLIGSQIDGFHWFNGEHIYKHTIDQSETVPAAGITRIDVRTISTNVRWSAAADNAIHVRLSGKTTRGNERHPRLMVAENGGLLTIKVERPKGIMFGFELTRLELHIEIPQNLKPEVSVETISGDVKLNDLQTAGLSVTTTSGDLNLSGIEADGLRFYTTSGDLTASGVWSDFNSRSISGDMRIKCTKLPDDIAVNSTSGDVELDLPDQAGFNLQARSVSGDIECKYPMVVGGRDRNKLKGTVGDGRANIVISTVAGNVEIY